MVLKLWCPSRTWMVRRSVPDSSKWVAKLCRNVCICTCLLRPEASRARWQTIWTVRTADRPVGLASGEEVRPGPVGLPVLAEDRQQPRREHHVAVLVPLALADVDDHAGAVDVLDAEPGDLGEPQPAGVGGHEQRAVLGVLQRVEEPGHLVLAEDDRELLGRLGAGDLLDDPLPAQGDAVEELEGQAGLLVDVPGDLSLLDQVEQVGADVLGPEVFGRGVEVLGEIGDPVDVESDRLGGQVVEDQVLGHATAQRRHGQLPSRWMRADGKSVRRLHDRGAEPGRERGCEDGAPGEGGGASQGEGSGRDVESRKDHGRSLWPTAKRFRTYPSR